MNLKYGSVCSGVEMASVAWMPLGWKPAFFSEIDEFPCTVLKHHYPNVPNLGNLKSIRCLNRKLGIYESGCEIPSCMRTVGKIDVLVGGTPCFPAGTPVLTPKGYVPIESLRVGDDVIGGSGEVRKVTDFGCRQDAEVGEIDIIGRGKFKCTPNHPFVVLDKLNGERRKECASDAHGKRSVFANVKPLSGLAPSVQIARLAGWFARYGRAYTKMSATRRTLCMFIPESRVDEFNKQGFRKVDGDLGIIRYSIQNDRGGGMDVYIEGLSRDWIEHVMISDRFGRDSISIPPFLYAGGEDNKQRDAFYEGLVGDGESEWVYMPTASQVYGVADAVPGSIVHRRYDGGFDVLIRERVKSNGRYKWRMFGGNETGRVREFKHDSGRVPVYNITVETDHTYVVCGCVVGNCQSFSVAGKKEGLEGVSGLVRSYFRLLDEIRPKVFVWENVKGCVSSDGGDAFKFILAKFAELGYSCAWRVLDSRFASVPGFEKALPQRRQRMFVVGCHKTPWEFAAEILFESECEHGNVPQMSREEPLYGRTSERRVRFHVGDEHASGQDDRFEDRILTFESFFFDYHGNDCRIKETDVAPTLAANNGDHIEGKEILVLDRVKLTDELITLCRRSNRIEIIGTNVVAVSSSIATSNVIADKGWISTVRRLTPEEAELLMGLPEGYTKVPCGKYDAEKCRDVWRYKACGNGFTVNVMRWIGQRIEMVGRKYNLFEE